MVEESGSPSDAVIKWMVCWWLDLTSRGGQECSAAEWEKSLVAAVRIAAPKVPFQLVNETCKQLEPASAGKCQGFSFKIPKKMVSESTEPMEDSQSGRLL